MTPLTHSTPGLPTKMGAWPDPGSCQLAIAGNAGAAGPPSPVPGRVSCRPPAPLPLSRPSRRFCGLYAGPRTDTIIHKTRVKLRCTALQVKTANKKPPDVMPGAACLFTFDASKKQRGLVILFRGSLGRCKAFPRPRCNISLYHNGATFPGPAVR